MKNVQELIALNAEASKERVALEVEMLELNGDHPRHSASAAIRGATHSSPLVRQAAIACIRRTGVNERTAMRWVRDYLRGMDELPGELELVKAFVAEVFSASKEAKRGFA